MDPVSDGPLASLRSETALKISSKSRFLATGTVSEGTVSAPDAADEPMVTVIGSLTRVAVAVWVMTAESVWVLVYTSSVVTGSPPGRVITSEALAVGAAGGA